MKERGLAACVLPFMQDRSLLERIARHLARHEADKWPDHVADAASILALMKEPDDAMRDVGDSFTWSAMIDAALSRRWTVAPGSSGQDGADGADEEGEISLPREAVGHDRADWVHLHDKEGKTS